MTTAPDPNDPSPFPSNPPQPCAVTASTLPKTLEESYQRIAKLERLVIAEKNHAKILEGIIAEKDRIIAEYLRDKGK